ncbi:ORF MSV077 hypothetical protein [Melanoplus sanguinipes entomopoxvirus]|uniref:Glycoprotein n=1 Tax=Melanoplus sanguinipes entomopoxvirus TaxID=83191 RepID=Q9YW15_MSEPV|nr:ORF MSV077 hypothetical protein [Melanoplus sanguinipes entomopoxvirus]AAC97632.1 ORF MSV077 hypothetical protein [Melanoplus sanguinipes entomopoxvirus 'O']
MHVIKLFSILAFFMPYVVPSPLPYICNDNKEHYFKLNNNLEHSDFECNYDSAETINVSIWKKTNIVVDSFIFTFFKIPCNALDLFISGAFSFYQNQAISLTDINVYIKNVSTIIIDGIEYKFKNMAGEFHTCNIKDQKYGIYVKYEKCQHVFKGKNNYIKKFGSQRKNDEYSNIFKRHCSNLKYEIGKCILVNDLQVKEYYIWDNSHKFDIKFSEQYFITPYIFVSNTGVLTKFENGFAELYSISSSNQIIKYDHVIITCKSDFIINIENGYFISMPFNEGQTVLSGRELVNWSQTFGKTICRNTENKHFVLNVTLANSLKNEYINIARFQEVLDKKLKIITKNLDTLCKNYVIYRKIYTEICKNNPQYCMKYFLNHYNVKARYIGGNIIGIKYCIEITDFEIIKDYNYKTDKCEIFVPMKININNTKFIGYMNPSTNEVFTESPKNDYCDSITYVDINDTLMYISNNQINVSTQKIHTYGHETLLTNKKISPIILKNINISDLYFEQSTFQDVYDIAYHHFDELINPKQTYNFDTSSIWDFLNFHGIFHIIFIGFVIFGIFILVRYASQIFSNCASIFRKTKVIYENIPMKNLNQSS